MVEHGVEEAERADGAEAGDGGCVRTAVGEEAAAEHGEEEGVGEVGVAGADGTGMMRAAASQRNARLDERSIGQIDFLVD